MKTTKKQVENAAKCANFMQYFKMLYWKQVEQKTLISPITLIDEKELDAIALELWKYLSI